MRPFESDKTRKRSKSSFDANRCLEGDVALWKIGRLLVQIRKVGGVIVSQ